ncbi:hypothetical protein ABH931_000135 [Streptacidiphilus sp. MAP12-33]|uniref:hypothetical protein n=1 Tax=Streptacidiphilus sp. MAP12-33 TaxID=3156266 RepID=UPI00351476AA
MGEFALVALLLAPFVGPLVFGLAGIALLVRWIRIRASGRAVGGLRLPGVLTCALIAVMAAAAASAAYGWGFFAGGVWEGPDKVCALKGVPGDHIVSRHVLPVSAQCVTSDGVGTELVSWWVNPVICAGLAALVAALVLGVVATARAASARAGRTG